MLRLKLQRILATGNVRKVIPSLIRIYTVGTGSMTQGQFSFIKAEVKHTI